jgi:hypothetical protein
MNSRSEITNDKWHMMQLKKAQTLEELRRCVEEIDYDVWENMTWTKVESKMDRVRNFYAYRMAQITF